MSLQTINATEIDYDVSMSNHSFAEEDVLMPGVTLRLQNKNANNSDIQFTFARTIPEYDNIISDEPIVQTALVQSAFYTKYTYRF